MSTISPIEASFLVAGSDRCANCNATGSIRELNLTTSELDGLDDCNLFNNFGKVNILDALEYIYKISWDNFIDKLQNLDPCKVSNYRDLILYSKDELCNVVCLCQKCAFRVSESYRFLKSFDCLTDPKSFFQSVRTLCKAGDDTLLQNNQDKDWDNGSVNNDHDEFPDYEAEDHTEEDIEIKYDPNFNNVSPVQNQTVENKTLSVLLDKISQPKLNDILKKGSAVKSKTRKANRKERYKPGTDVNKSPASQRKLVQSKSLNGSKKTSKYPELSTSPLKTELDSSVHDPGCEGNIGKSTDDEPRKKAVRKRKGIKKKSSKVKAEDFVMGYKCKKCPEVFSKMTELLKHKRVHKLVRPPGPGPYICDLCGKEFRSFDYYHFKHRPRVHANCSVICQICGKMYKNSYSLKIHVNTMHLDEEERAKKKIACPTCGKLVLPEGMKSHVETHIAERKKFKCDHCDKVYLSDEKRRLHMVLHDPNISQHFGCAFCGKKFAGNYALKRHEQRHSQDNKSHDCDICGKGFREKYLLVRHKVMHQSDRPFSCEHCGKTFKSEEYLYLHIKSIHEGKRQIKSGKTKCDTEPDPTSISPHSCTICGKTFSKEKGLLRHQAYHMDGRGLQASLKTEKGGTVLESYRDESDESSSDYGDQSSPVMNQ